jgi:N-carbamoyl-L-amino-acid hydrolase
MVKSPNAVNVQRQLDRTDAMAQIGSIDGDGVNRLALRHADQRARNLLVGWMRELDLEVSIDQIGNIVGTRAATNTGPPVMTGSHIDSVATGRRYDGTLGVLAGLEGIQTLNDENIETFRPIAVGCFANEKGARFAPDMLGRTVRQCVRLVRSTLSPTCWHDLYTQSRWHRP